MNVVLLGPPGAGKGTQAEFIQKSLGLLHISTGDMLRAAIAKGDSLGKEVKSIVDSGQYVSDAIMIQLVKGRIAQPDCIKGFVLDGFPRTLEQAQALENAGVKVDYVVQIDVPEEVVVQRIAGRRIDAQGNIYNIYFHPPADGLVVTQRPDDHEQVVRKRLAVYHQKTEPLVSWYKDKAQQSGLQFMHVDGAGSEQSVSEEILNKLNPKKTVRSMS